MEQARRTYAHFVQWLRRKYGYGIEYVRAPEFTKIGRIHVHTAMIMPFVRQSDLSRAWNVFSHGAFRIDIRAAKPGLAKELAKYLGKNMSAGHISRSKGWPKAPPAVPEGEEAVNQVPRDPETGLCSGCGSEHRFWYVKTDELSEHDADQVFIVPSCGCWSTGKDEGLTMASMGWEPLHPM